MFGQQLKRWRGARGLSQLELGLQASVSARHLSFLENGRARPSRGMVLRLAAALDLPLRERNQLLLDGGYAPHYGEHSLDDDALAEALQALRFLLEAHEPYPAFVLDRYWDIVAWNRPQALLLQDLAVPGGSLAHLNALDLVFEPGVMRDDFLNWDEVASAVLRRLRRQVAHAGTDDRLRALWEKVLAAPGVADLSPVDAPPPMLVPMRMRQGDQVFTWFNTLAVFGATGEVTLEELVIESFFPGDEVTRAFILELAAQQEPRDVNR
jgi:transcriptional regulator with XRE-family HTH domain